MRQAGGFVGKGKQRIAFRATEATARMFAEKENYKSEDQTEADGEGEGNDGHGNGE